MGSSTDAFRRTRGIDNGLGSSGRVSPPAIPRMRMTMSATVSEVCVASHVSQRCSFLLFLPTLSSSRPFSSFLSLPCIYIVCASHTVARSHVRTSQGLSLVDTESGRDVTNEEEILKMVKDMHRSLAILRY